MQHDSFTSIISVRNVLQTTALLTCMALTAGATAQAPPPTSPPTNPPTNSDKRPPLGGPQVDPGAADSEKGFDGGKQGGKQGGKKGRGESGAMNDERTKGMLWMRTFEQMKPTLSADVQTKADAIKAQFDSEMKAWKDTNGDKQKALVEQMKATNGQKPDPALMDQMKALRDTMPKMEDSQKQIFALMSESEQAAFKTKLDANEKQMKSLRVNRDADEMGSGPDGKGPDGKGQDGKGKGGKGKGGKGGPGGKPEDGQPPAGGDGDKAPPPPPFDP